ncbi:MAG: hypothetical protein U0X20_17105 [Caldilineaceae bacterium]
MNDTKLTKRQVATILARHGYLPDPPNPAEPLAPHELIMSKRLGGEADEFIVAFVDTTGEGTVCFSALPLGKIHVTSYDVPINPEPPRADSDNFFLELLEAEEMTRQARWAVITHVHQVEIRPIPRNDGQAAHRGAH